jgi:hypothetical protein
MLQPFFKRARTKIFTVLATALLLLPASAADLKADEGGCGWACISTFGLIHVHDGEVHYYAGCVTEGNNVYCYYGVLMS